MEEEFESPPSSIWFFAVAVALAAYALVRVFTNSVDLAFPQLPNGTYVGWVTGLGALASEHATIYLESNDDGRSLALSVFLENVPLRRISLRERTVGEGGSGTANRTVFLPVKFSIHGVDYMLYGHHSRASWSGGLIASDGGGGKWLLERLQEDPEEVPNAPSFELRKWMYVASQNKLLEEESASIAKQINISNSLLTDLKKAEEGKTELQKRIEMRIPELNKQLQSIQEENDQMTKEVEERVRELDLLARLSKKGKLVLLSRRILNREKGWYFANWSPEFAGETASQPVTATTDVMPGMDADELESRFEKAQQTADVYDKVQREKLEIKRLERMISDAENKKTEVKNESNTNKSQGTEEEGSFWDRLFR